MPEPKVPADDGQDAKGDTLISRRRVVRAGAVALVGGLIVLAFGLAAERGGRPSPDETTTPYVGIASPKVTQSGPVRVKAVYFQMKELMPVEHEYRELPAPASVGALVETIQSDHPQFATMSLSMSILVDGQVATYATPLWQGDEVDFVPMLQGG